MSDSVGNIHRRFYLTLINPSSYKTSLFVMFISIAITSIVINLTNLDKLIYRLPLSLAVAYLTTKIDYRLLKDLEITSLSKIYHVAAFATLIWLITVLLGVLSDNIFMRTSQRYIVEGMILAIGFRICIFTSVFNAGSRALFVSSITPLLLFISFADVVLLFDPQSLLFGSILLGIAIIWSVLADRAGKPWVNSTFKLLQAYILAWTKNKTKAIEDIMNSNAKYVNTSTKMLMFDDAKTAIVLPDIHPGPFNPVGGSNLPAEINHHYYKQGVNTMIMHSISDHSMNIASKEEVMNYINGLNDMNVIAIHDSCSEPISVSIGKATVTGLRFDNSIILMLSLSPYGMEDIDVEVKDAVEKYAKRLNMNLLFIDTHNALGKHLNDEDKANMIDACKEIIDKLSIAKQYKFMVGSSDWREIKFDIKHDIGNGGFSVIAIQVNDNTYTIGWFDANNMTPGLREYIIKYLKDHGIKMIEICTSDTHATFMARNKQGYHTLGSISDWTYLSNALLTLSKLAISRLKHSKVVLMTSNTMVRLMGHTQFDNYSKALDKSLNLTKITLTFTIAVYTIMLIIG